jgi:glucan-binding YG repeat protein
VDIQLHDVESSNIKAIGFDEQSSTLRIAFHATADVYDYASVPQSVYSLLLASPSKGEFFRGYIKEHYRFTKINPARERITMSKKQAATVKPATQPQPSAAPPAPTPTLAATVAASVPATPSKQEVTIGKLKDAWIEKKVDLSKMQVKQDGKFILITVADGWPIVQIGASGGIVLPEIRSYPKAFEAALIGKELYDKQKSREAKKSSQPAPAPTTTQPAPAPQQKETPSAKKAKAHQKLEATLQEATA